MHSHTYSKAIHTHTHRSSDMHSPTETSSVISPLHNLLYTNDRVVECLFSERRIFYQFIWSFLPVETTCCLRKYMTDHDFTPVKDLFSHCQTSDELFIPQQKSRYKNTMFRWTSSTPWPLSCMLFKKKFRENTGEYFVLQQKRETFNNISVSALTSVFQEGNLD